MVLWQHLEKVKKWLGEGRKSEAATLLHEMLKRPDQFWRGDYLDHKRKTRQTLRTDNTYAGEFNQATFAFEEVGMLVLEMAQQLEDREARLTMIQQVIKEQQDDALGTESVKKLTGSYWVVSCSVPFGGWRYCKASGT